MFPPAREVGTNRYSIMLNGLEMLFMILDRECTYAEIADHLQVSAKTVERMVNAIGQIVTLKITRPSVTVQYALRAPGYFDSEEHRGKNRVSLARKDFDEMLEGFRVR